jgi:hypothetical protein
MADRLFGQFDVQPDEERATYPLRLRMIAGLEPRGYLDSGPVALSYALRPMLDAGRWTMFHAALTELENLYAPRLTIVAVEQFLRFLSGTARRSS